MEWLDGCHAQCIVVLTRETFETGIAVIIMFKGLQCIWVLTGDTVETGILYVQRFTVHRDVNERGSQDSDSSRTLGLQSLSLSHTHTHTHIDSTQSYLIEFGVCADERPGSVADVHHVALALHAANAHQMSVVGCGQTDHVRQQG